MIKAYTNQFFILQRSFFINSNQGFIHPTYRVWDMDHVDEYLVAIKNENPIISPEDIDRFECTYDIPKDKYAIVSEQDILSSCKWLKTDHNGHYW